MIQTTPDGVILNVRVIPRAKHAGLAGTRGDALLVRLTAPPVDGAANLELIEVLSSAFAIPRREVAIVAGQASRAKRVRLTGIDAATARSRMESLAARAFRS